MAINCEICSNEFGKGRDKIILCRYKDGIVHQGCCTSQCSLNNKPCRHSMGIFRRSKFKGLIE